MASLAGTSRIREAHLIMQAQRSFSGGWLFRWMVSLTVLLGVLRSQGLCDCEVVNSGQALPGSGTCNWPGQGTIPCFTVALGSVPGAIPPESGRCHKVTLESAICPIENLRECTYSPVRLVVTLAPCAQDCMGATSLEVLLDNQSFDPKIIMSPGGTFPVDVDAANVSSLCGTIEHTKRVTMTTPKGRTALELRFNFGCLQCTAIAGDGG
jgi:hypothetical protein